jgi:hypothetical protein
MDDGTQFLPVFRACLCHCRRALALTHIPRVASAPAGAVATQHQFDPLGLLESGGLFFVKKPWPHFAAVCAQVDDGQIGWPVRHATGRPDRAEPVCEDSVS